MTHTRPICVTRPPPLAEHEIERGDSVAGLRNSPRSFSPSDARGGGGLLGSVEVGVAVEGGGADPRRQLGVEAVRERHESRSEASCSGSGVAMERTGFNGSDLQRCRRGLHLRWRC